MSASSVNLNDSTYVPPTSPPVSSPVSIRSFSTGDTIPFTHPIEYNLKSVRKLDEELILLIPSSNASINEVRGYLSLWFRLHDLDPRPNILNKVYWGGRQLHELPKTRLYYDLTLWGFGAPYSYGIMMDIVRGRAILANIEKKKKSKATRKLEEAKRLKEERLKRKEDPRGGYFVEGGYEDDISIWVLFYEAVSKLVTLCFLLVLIFDLYASLFNKLKLGRPDLLDEFIWLLSCIIHTPTTTYSSSRKSTNLDGQA